MTEALQTRLRSSSAYFELYLRGAELKAILRDTATVGTERLVLIPAPMFGLLVERLTCAPPSFEVARYLSRASGAFLRYLDTNAPDLLGKLLVVEATPGEPDEAVGLGCRLHSLGLLTDERRESLWTAVREAFEYNGAYGFLEVDGAAEALGVDRVKAYLTAERDSGYSGLERLYDWLTEDLSSVETAVAEQGLDVLDRYLNATAPVFTTLEVLEEQGLQELKEQVQYTCGLLSEKLSEIEEKKARREDHDYDDYKEQWREERYELEHGLFSDVDE